MTKTGTRTIKIPQGLTPNQIVAANLHRLRTSRGWSQTRLAERFALRGFPGWTVSKISDAENARLSEEERHQKLGDRPRGQRERQFTVNDLIAIARVFNVSAIALLVPPTGAHVRIGNGVVPRRSYTLAALHLELDDGYDVTAFESALHDQFRKITQADLEQATKDSFATLQAQIKEWGGAAGVAELDQIMREAESTMEGVRRAFDLYLRLSGRERHRPTEERS